jgi:hypothetical protein
MKKLFLSILVLGLLFGGNAFAKTGKGELKLTKGTMTFLMQYLYGAGNPNYSSCDTNHYAYKAIKHCEKLSNGSPCYTFATKRKIKWKNSINKKSTTIKKKILKDPYQVAKIIQDLGFYDGDISKLPGIDYKTGQVDNDNKVKGTKSNIVKKKKTKKNIQVKKSIVISWDGYENLITGKVGEESDEGQTIINFQLTNSDSCEGNYLMQSGGKGTWQIACTNNMGAAGTLKWTETGGITGKGRDYNDKKVKFIVSKKS